MATIGISEFTFGYAFLFEQTHANWAHLRAAPILPSLQQEHDQGWDAHLPLAGTDFYYQFKLSDHLSRGNASFIADGTYGNAYYRLALHRRENNRQHQRLRLHAQSHPNTFYVAPEFNSIDDFNTAFLARQIANQSRMIALVDCDDITDAEQHYITFQHGSPNWLQHSTKKPHKRSYLGRDVEKLYRETEAQWRPLDQPFARELFLKTSDVVKAVLARERPQIAQPLPLLDFNPMQAERGDILLRTSQILSVVLRVTLVLVGTSN